MSRWAPLARVRVDHGYFGSRPCAGLGFELESGSERMADRVGLIVRSRPEDGTILVLHDGSRRNQIEEWGAASPEGLFLDFRLVVRDALLANYTELPQSRTPAEMVFDSRRVERDEAGSLRITPEWPESAALGHAGGLRLFLTEADGRVLGDDDEGDGRVLGDEDEADGRVLGDEDERHRVPEYRLTLLARATYWRYLLLGDLAREDVSITDLDEATEFRRDEHPVKVAGGRSGFRFVSGSPIPLQRRSDRRFQLRSTAEGPEGGRVLLKRLPVASVGRLGQDTIDGELAFVSDIYVNR